MKFSNRVLMKKRDLEKKLKEYGWLLARHGGSHDIWTNGLISTQVPRHPEVNELLAKNIIKQAQKCRGLKE